MAITVRKMGHVSLGTSLSWEKAEVTCRGVTYESFIAREPRDYRIAPVDFQNPALGYMVDRADITWETFLSGPFTTPEAAATALVAKIG